MEAQRNLWVRASVLNLIIDKSLSSGGQLRN